jgi:hypothetical protein
MSPDADPSITIFGSLFAEEAKYAVRILKSGHEEYARSLLRSIPGYCISCHTRTPSGPSFSSLPLNPASDALTPVEKGEFFAASRQYDRATAEFDRELADEKAPKAEPVEWSHAIKYSLAIAVRVKKDPAAAEKIVDRILAATEAPFYLKQDAAKWKESIRDWRNEPRRSATSEEGLYSEAVRLLTQAHEFQRYPADHAADVLYLRASSAVHELLQAAPRGRYAGEAYLMAGLCYDVLRSFNVGELHEIYYEACIRNNPHSTLSETCFKRLEESAYEGFTGSGGTHLPEDLKEKLRTLEELSRVQAPKTAKVEP